MDIIRRIEEGLLYIGADDRKIDKFESTISIPNGVSYNSYLFLDEKTCLLDTADQDVSKQFLENLEAGLSGRKLDYLVINHMEPDHAYNIGEVLLRHPETRIVSNSKALLFLSQFFPKLDLAGKTVAVKEGDVLSLGKHTLSFYLTPMVHWPEVMMTFEKEDGLLFSADAFGTFNTLDGNLFADDTDFSSRYLESARNYYANIVGKYGAQVQMAFKKLPVSSIKMILPLHGPIWRKDIPYILDKYQHWSTYSPEEKAASLFYCSMYGNTENAARLLASMLGERGMKDIHVLDLCRSGMGEAVGESFRVSNLVLLAPTYNLTLYPEMDTYLTDILRMGLKNRKVSLVANGTWAPVEMKLMKEKLSTVPGMEILPTDLTILSALTEKDREVLGKMADEIVSSLR